ncbi:hypothetical protein Nmel_009203 [Mimus melanotis]
MEFSHGLDSMISEVFSNIIFFCLGVRTRSVLQRCAIEVAAQTPWFGFCDPPHVQEVSVISRAQLCLQGDDWRSGSLCHAALPGSEIESCIKDL